MPVDFYLHIANILYLLSYLVKDILILRIITVVAICTLIPFFIMRKEPLFIAVCWNLLFASVNIYQIIQILKERRPVYFDEIDQKIYDTTFASLSRRQFNNLLKISVRSQARVSESLCEAGNVLDKLFVIHSGTATIKLDDQIVDRRTPGDFIGERTLVTDLPIKANIEAETELSYTSWPKADLQKILDNDPGLHAGFQQTISRFLINKLEA